MWSYETNLRFLDQVPVIGGVCLLWALNALFMNEQSKISWLYPGEKKLADEDARFLRQGGAILMKADKSLFNPLVFVPSSMENTGRGTVPHRVNDYCGPLLTQQNMVTYPRCSFQVLEYCSPFLLLRRVLCHWIGPKL